VAPSGESRGKLFVPIPAIISVSDDSPRVSAPSPYESRSINNEITLKVSESTGERKTYGVFKVNRHDLMDLLATDRRDFFQSVPAKIVT
jgi:hypothetical protein